MGKKLMRVPSSRSISNKLERQLGKSQRENGAEEISIRIQAPTASEMKKERYKRNAAIHYKRKTIKCFVRVFILFAIIPLWKYFFEPNGCWESVGRHP